MKKKRLIWLCLISLIVGLAQPATADLIGWWPFEDGSGNIAEDASENEAHALLLGDPVWGTNGQHGDALLLDGDGDFGHVESSYSLPRYSVGMWFRVDGGSAERDLLGIYADELLFGILLEVRPDGTLRYLHRPDAGADINIFTDASYDEGTWHHIAAVKSSDEMVLYMDGEIVGSAANSTLLPDPMNRLVFGVLDHGRNLRFFPGPIDEVFVYNHALSAQEVQAAMDGRGPGMGPELAADLHPKDGSTDVLRDVVLEWIPGEFAATHDVYIGTSFDDVNDASRVNPLDALASQDQTDTTYDAGVLSLGQTYYWRVDEVNSAPDSAIYKGTVWSFAVEPVSYAIEGIIATSNGTPDVGADPENTVNGSGLSTDDQHSVESSDMWLASPASDEPLTITFEFDRVYKMHEMLVWNYNVAFELLLGFGIKDATVEYSTDGAEWATLGDVELAQATAQPDYAVNTTVDLQGVPAQYVRLVVNSAHGVMGKFGLSEVRFMQIPAHAREPQPADGEADVAVIDTALSWRAGREAVTHEVYLSTDPDALELIDTTSATTIDPGALDLAATYYWKIDEVNEAEVTSTWEGTAWSFSTEAYIVVDDFESYDDEDNRIYQSWVDGYGVDTNGSTVGHLESPFAEQTVVKSGKQSMPLFYDNTTAGMSEATRSFDAQNWVQSGIKGLRLSFYGDPTNTATQMYVKINGTQVDYDGDAATIQQKPWHTWYVDLTTLAGVNLESVTELAIGFTGGRGVVYLDDIVLTPLARQLVTPVEPSATDLVVQYAFEGNAADSTGANSGTVEGTPEFVAGKNGQAIKLDGMDDYVTVEGSFDLVTYSASLWFRVEGGTGPRDILSVYDSAGAFGILLELQDNSTLRYLKRPLGTTGDTNIYTTSTFDDGAWYHVAIVKSLDVITLFVNGESMGSQADTTAYDDGALHRITLGVLKHDNLIRYFPGAIDDFSLYSRALSQDEIAWLAGRTDPFDE